MKPHRRQFLHLAAGAAALPFAPHVARAQAYPTQPVRILVGFAPGVAPDITGRLLADKFSAAWGKPVVVENVTGAGGNVATERVARAAPDGYTLLMGGIRRSSSARACTTSSPMIRSRTLRQSRESSSPPMCWSCTMMFRPRHCRS